jgi:SAM-dependent MidA family methyltransferase
LIKRYMLSKTNYRTILSQIISSIQSNEKIILEISIDEHYMINDIIKYLRHYGLSVVYGDNNNEIIRLLVIKRD